MSLKIFLLISISIKIIDCLYLEAEANYLKPKLERNNIINKGVWVRNRLKDSELFEKTNLGKFIFRPGIFMFPGNFIFRPNSVDVDNPLQNNFDAFGETTLQDPLFVSNYGQRTRRAPEHMRKRRPRKSMKIPKVIKTSIEDSVMIKSKIVSNLKPSVLNEYPYEVAILLNNDPHEVKNITLFKERHDTILNVNKSVSHFKDKTDAKDKEIVMTTKIPNVTTADVPKRSKKYDHDTDIIHKYNTIDKYNTTNDAVLENGAGQEFFIKDERMWNQNSPLTDSNVYQVVPKESERVKSISERGLIKVISMLTKTFKKITKQHNEIKIIHNKLINVNKNVELKEANLISKFEDFDSKYSDMIQFNDKVKALETHLESQKQYFEIKQKEIQNTFLEFQSQQKNFLAQQRQFYTIQKLMLAQNEKINAKQNLIAKTQSEISLRQNNFARILKKAKQIINDSNVKVGYSQVKKNDEYKDTYENTVIPITTPKAANTQAMKINLFAIPTKSKLKNQDALIIKEKDNKQIDDLIYKFYFNNTFIDSLMKSKVLNNYETNTNSIEIVSRSNQAKNKRDELETTLMLPLSDTPGKRERRWINHFSKNKYRRVNRHRKETTAVITERNKMDDDTKRESEVKVDQHLNEVKSTGSSMKNDPFLAMATNFCNEIGQNINEQVLKWCIEKALRRLKFMEMNAFTPPSVTIGKDAGTPGVTQPMSDITNKLEELPSLPSTVMVRSQELATTLEPLVTPPVVVSTPVAGQTIFFPDNDELESNLKQYDLKPDTEGNVYYDGSVHISDFEHMLPTTDSGEGTSDIMPGLADSNSRVEMDPLAFDIQAKRRAYVRRINESILKQMERIH